MKRRECQSDERCELIKAEIESRMSKDAGLDDNFWEGFWSGTIWADENPEVLPGEDEMIKELVETINIIACGDVELEAMELMCQKILDKYKKWVNQSE